MFRRKSKTPAFEKETYEEVIERVGSLGITERERKEILKAINKAIEDKKKQLKPEEMSMKAFKALEDTLGDYAALIGDAASQTATDIIAERIPSDLSARVKDPEGFGTLMTEIETVARGIMDDVIQFHSAFEGVYIGTKKPTPEFDKVMTLLKDIQDHKENTQLREHFLTLRTAHGNIDQIKKLERQIIALEKTNKAFATQYNQVNFDVVQVWWVLQDLADAFEEQDKELKQRLVRASTGSDKLDIQLSTDGSLGLGSPTWYEERIKLYSKGLNADRARKVFKDSQPRLTDNLLNKIPFEKIAAEEARNAYETVKTNKTFAEQVAQATTNFENRCATRAESLYRLMRDSPGAAAGVIAKGFMAGVATLVEDAKAGAAILEEGLLRSRTAASELLTGAREEVEAAIGVGETVIEGFLDKLTPEEDPEFTPEAVSERMNMKFRIIEVQGQIDQIDEKIKKAAAEMATLNKSKGAKSGSKSYRQKKKNLKNELASFKAAKAKLEEEKERLVGESGLSTVLLRPEGWAFEDEVEDEDDFDNFDS
tara:strand:- start:5080 stop:6699 length:1620 start_codon:yes stop_codon:yes gene_type:complete